MERCLRAHLPVLSTLELPDGTLIHHPGARCNKWLDFRVPDQQASETAMLCFRLPESPRNSVILTSSGTLPGKVVVEKQLPARYTGGRYVPRFSRTHNPSRTGFQIVSRHQSNTVSTAGTGNFFTADWAPTDGGGENASYRNGGPCVIINPVSTNICTQSSRSLIEKTWARIVAVGMFC